MKTLSVLVFALFFAFTAQAGFQGYNGTTNLGVLSGAKCSTGLSCSKVGSNMVFTVAQPTFTLANGEIINNTVDDTVEVKSDDNDTTFQITGYDAKAAILNLWADRGDDAADKFSFTATTADTLLLKNSTTQILGFSSAGVMTLADSETITNASDVITFGFDDAAAEIKVKAFEGTNSSITLQADESDDNGDDWKLTSVDSDNSFTIANDVSGAQVAKMTISATAGNVTGPGTGYMAGYLKNLVQATATTITAAQCGMTFYNAGAIQMELPEASTVPGCTLTFVTLNASNFDINPDTGDKIVTLTDANGDAMRNATVGNTVTIQAVSASQWVVIGINGTWTDIN